MESVGRYLRLTRNASNSPATSRDADLKSGEGLSVNITDLTIGFQPVHHLFCMSSAQLAGWSNYERPLAEVDGTSVHGLWKPSFSVVQCDLHSELSCPAT